jgi:hypothetical protein
MVGARGNLRKGCSHKRRATDIANAKAGEMHELDCGKRRGAVVSAELGEAIQAGGGPDAALMLLSAAAGHPPDAAREGEKP